MNDTERIKSGLTIFTVAILTVLLSAFLLFALSQLGVIAFIGGGWLISSFHSLTGYLGYSILFFIPALLGFILFFILLKKSLSDRYEGNNQEENIRFYNGGVEIFITLFFAIGVLFTAWGLQNALVSALGGVSKLEAGRIGAWGILQRMVENGILIALWTTIVGGAGGYLMRLAKYIFLGRELNRFSVKNQENDKAAFFDALESIKNHVKHIDEKMSKAN